MPAPLETAGWPASTDPLPSSVQDACTATITMPVLLQGVFPLSQPLLPRATRTIPSPLHRRLHVCFRHLLLCRNFSAIFL